jgi:GAF domain-containing protein
VAGDRRERILGLLVGGPDGAFGTKRLCQVCAEVTAMSGAGIMLMAADVAQGSLCTSNAMSDLIEQLQYALGEGPCVDAYNQDWPVLEPDLAHPETPRWLAFAPPAVAGGVRAIFGFPLQVGSVRLGALNLCRDRTGPLSDDQHADALVMADIAAQAVLVMQANAPPGKLASELGAGADFHLAVHQASGMIAAQLGVSVRDAMVRLRAYAFGNDRSLPEVAKEVVDRKLRFDVASSETDRNG